MKSTIQSIIKQFGPSVLLTENRFCAILDDLAPKDKAMEKKVVRRMAQTHLLQELHQEVFANNADKSQGVIVLLVKMQAEGFPEEWAKTALDIFGLDKSLISHVYKSEQAFGSEESIEPSGASLRPPDPTSSNPVVAENLRRGHFALDDNEWEDAKSWFEKALRNDSECAEAYLGLTLVELHCVDLSQFQILCHKYGLPDSSSWKMVEQLASGELRKWLDSLLKEDQQRQLTADQVSKAFRNKLQNSQKPTAKELLDEETKNQQSLELVFESFDAITAEEAAAIAELHGIEAKETQLRAQRSQLGIFKGKEKRSIDEQLSSIIEQKHSLSQKIESISGGRKGFQSKAMVEQALEKSKAVAHKYRLEIEEESKQGGISFDDAMQIYRHDFAVRKILNARDPSLGIRIDLLSGAATISLGSYWQSLSEVPLPIEWLVLKNTGKRALVISKFGLDSMAFNDRRADFTWETCSLRKWLNGEFFQAAFSAKEQSMIPRVTVPAVNNDIGHAQAGNNTTDRVFVLNVPEAESYFKNDAARVCAGTEFCFMRGAKNENNGNVEWWLRTPGGIQSTATSVTATGYVASGGYFGDTIGTAVRPAMWIDIAE